MPGNKNKFQKSCARLFGYFFVKSKKKRCDRCPPTQGRREQNGRRGNQDIVSYLFSGVHTPLNLIRAQPKKEKKSQTGNWEFVWGSHFVTLLLLHKNTHNVLFFSKQPTERAPASQKYISLNSLSRADNNNNNNIKFNVACSTDECAAEIPDTRLSNSWEVIVYFISFYSQRTGWNGPIKSNQKKSISNQLLFGGILGGHPHQTFLWTV